MGGSRISIASFVSLSKPISGALEDMAEAGVQLVELHGDVPANHIDLTDEFAVDALARAVEKLPLEIYSVHCAFSQPSEEAWDISQPDPDKRAAALQRRKKVIVSAARLGARCLVVHPGSSERGEEGGLARSRETLVEIVQTARQARVRIAVENQPPEQAGGSLAEMQRLLENLDPEVAGFCLDTGHAMLGQDGPCEYVHALGDRLIAVHWHSNNRRDDTHVFPGVDHTDWGAFLAALDGIGYDLPVTVEAVPPETVPLAQAVRELEAALREKRTPRFP